MPSKIKQQWSKFILLPGMAALIIGTLLLPSGCKSDWDPPARGNGVGSIGVYARKAVPDTKTDRVEMLMLGMNPNYIEVTRVIPGGPGDQAGISKGDLLIGLVGEGSYATNREAIESIRQIAPGEKVRLLIEREGERQEVTAEVCNVRDLYGAMRDELRDPEMVPDVSAVEFAEMDAPDARKGGADGTP